MRFTTSNGTELAYEHTNGETILVFIHGWVENKKSWKPITEHFNGKEYGTLAVDLPGHGDSQAPKREEPYTIEQMAQSIHELIESVEAERVIVIGHSLGGMIAQHYAARHRPEKLVLINTSAHNPATDSAKDLLQRVERLAKGSPGEDLKESMKMLKKTDPYAALRCLRNILDLDTKPLIAQLDMPVCIIVGEHDALTPVTLSEELAQTIPASELHIITGAGHNTPVTHTKEVIEILDEFL